MQFGGAYASDDEEDESQSNNNAAHDDVLPGQNLMFASLLNEPPKLQEQRHP